MKSMTGFGRVEFSTKLGRLAVEISSLNNRFLDFTFRAPRQFYPLEIQVREIIAAQLNRGKVNVNVGFEESESSPGTPLINKKAAKAYYRQLQALKKELKIPGDITMDDILSLPDIARPDQMELDYDRYWKMLETGVKRALKQLVAMRKREGEAMGRDMGKILRKMSSQVDKVEKGTANSVEHYRKQLTERINEILETNLHNSVRLEEEIALFADRSDITEECSRLRSHIVEFQRTLKLSEPIGKRLNFILQEMNREANTIGSKCSGFSIATTVITMKEEIEKLREIVQNIE